MCHSSVISLSLSLSLGAGAREGMLSASSKPTTRPSKLPGISPKFPRVIDLLTGLFRGAVFRHGEVALKQPIKQPTETPTSTLALMGRFPSLMGRFPTLMGRFADFVLRGRFTSWKSTGKQPIKKRGIKRLLIENPRTDLSSCQLQLELC